MEQADIQALWAKVQAGDQAAFAVVFDTYGREILSFCFRRTGDHSTAEDLTSVVFWETWRRRGDVAAGELKPWLYGVATNIVRNQWRSTRRYRKVLERLHAERDSDDFTDELAARVDAERAIQPVLAELRKLPRRERDVVALCVWQGLSSAEAATALGVPAATIRTRLHRARRAIEGGLSEDDGVTTQWRKRRAQ